MTETPFALFFSDKALGFVTRAIRLALDEDGADMTSDGLFRPEDTLVAEIVAKEESILAGLPFMELVLDALDAPESCRVESLAKDGDRVEPGRVVGRITGPASLVLKAERVILNFITHLSGIATLTARYVAELEGTRTTLLDTRKTLPGLRYPEKYAVLMGGGRNHRLDLQEMLMLKDNHIDRAGSIAGAVRALRQAWSPCPPMEVECRTLADVEEAVAEGVERIMLDNMDHDTIREALAMIPDTIESEISGGVNLETVRAIGELGPTYVSVGRLTHSAPSADYSMRIHAALHMNTTERRPS